jgi:hypothetical protein
MIVLRNFNKKWDQLNPHDSNRMSSFLRRQSYENYTKFLQSCKKLLKEKNCRMTWLKYLQGNLGKLAICPVTGRPTDLYPSNTNGGHKWPYEQAHACEKSDYGHSKIIMNAWNRTRDSVNSNSNISRDDAFEFLKYVVDETRNILMSEVSPGIMYIHPAVHRMLDKNPLMFYTYFGPKISELFGLTEDILFDYKPQTLAEREIIDRLHLKTRKNLNIKRVAPELRKDFGNIFFKDAVSRKHPSTMDNLLKGLNFRNESVLKDIMSAYNMKLNDSTLSKLKEKFSKWINENRVSNEYEIDRSKVREVKNILERHALERLN